MTKQVDQVEGEMISIRSTQKTEAYLVVDHKSKELKKHILKEVDQKMIALETRFTHQMNKNR